MATVDAAMDRNQDLAAAAARMRAAKYQQLAGRARVKPDASLLTSGSVSRSENGRAPAQSSESYGLSLSTSWELDVWGRLRDLNAADEADQVATEALFRGARLSLAASTARSWCNLIAAEQQLELAHITLDSFQRNLRISERNYKGTGQGALDVQFGRTNVASAQRDLESRRLARDEAARTLEVLTGRFPAGTTRAGHELPTLPKKVPAGLPSELLDRRPDLTAARASLLASAHRAHASRKSLLPSLRLTSSAGTPVSGFSQLLNPDWLVASIGANLVQTLDTGGAQKLEARAALEQNQAAVHDYQQVALTAFREVESALDADQSLARQEDFLVAEVEQAALAERQSTRDYADGIEGSDILDVLEAQRRANNARSSLIRLRNERLLNRIDLHLALGGDFKTRGA
ncbi:NodT family efflux transporter outer membrane factor (OMF) lipoprotein [Haloferula luteola]|uniref:NodT family efflux transporter outer membrane factor (OMF) lipoprotein n=2 Tax=Haloferula luteola TaxID=595692 RepID=A0A840V346_9BACT|nr:NodT family efflux transporter outer membrane factor (OMF) lipoprotein [Haloferula luteola]